ncbi:MAG: hypothetical protein AAF990_09090 [Bacteroidota bacterium]
MTPSVQSRIQVFIAKNQTEAALELLSTEAGMHRPLVTKKVTMLSARLQRLKENARKDTISSGDYDVALNQIHEAIIDISQSSSERIGKGNPAYRPWIISSSLALIVVVVFLWWQGGPSNQQQQIPEKVESTALTQPDSPAQKARPLPVETSRVQPPPVIESGKVEIHNSNIKQFIEKPSGDITITNED